MAKTLCSHTLSSPVQSGCMWLWRFLHFCTVHNRYIRTQYTYSASAVRFSIRALQQISISKKSHYLLLTTVKSSTVDLEQRYEPHRRCLFLDLLFSFVLFVLVRISLPSHYCNFGLFSFVFYVYYTSMSHIWTNELLWLSSIILLLMFKYVRVYLIFC